MTEIKENEEDIKTFCMVVGIIGLLALFLYFMTTTSFFGETKCTEFWPPINSTEYSSCMPFLNYSCPAGYICVPQVQGGCYIPENVRCTRECLTEVVVE